jgi:hypothetical protein
MVFSSVRVSGFSPRMRRYTLSALRSSRLPSSSAREIWGGRLFFKCANNCCCNWVGSIRAKKYGKSVITTIHLLFSATKRLTSPLLIRIFHNRCRRWARFYGFAPVLPLSYLAVNYTLLPAGDRFVQPKQCTVCKR